MNRFALLAVGLFACVTGSGCYHCCYKHRNCVGWQGGCYAEPGCGAPLMKGARLQHHRPRTDCDDGFDDCDDNCTECGRRCHGRGDGLCDDCGRYGRRDSREARRDAREARRASRRGRNCDRCGGSCTGECYVESYAVPCGGCSGCSSCAGVEMGGYPAGMIGTPMMGAPVMGEGMMMPSGGSSCSSCASGGMSTGSYQGMPMYQGSVVSGQIINGAQIGTSNGWVSSPTSSYVPSEPLPAPGASGTNFIPTGSTAPAPGTFPTPAR